MPSLNEALAALIAQMTAGEFEAAGQYATYPGFFFPVTSEALANDGRPAAFDFIHRVNMVPANPPHFMMRGLFVWKIYQQILRDRVLAADEGGQHGYAKRFIEAEAEMGDGLLSPEENPYFSTNVTPSDITSPANWSVVAMDAPRIKALAAGLAPAQQQWLERFNTLFSLGDDFVDSITYERATLLLLRPWFDPSIFELRFWDLPGQQLSDGLDPPSGKLPGVVSKLILVRNFKVRLAATTMPDVGPAVIYRRADGAAPPPSSPIEQLVALGKPERPPAILLNPLRADAGTAEQQIDSIQSASALEIGLTPDGRPSGAQRFHVPILFDVSAAREVTNAELVKAEKSRSEAATAVEQSRGTISGFEAQIAVLAARSTRRDLFANRMRLPAHAMMQKLKLDLASAQSTLQVAESNLAATEILVTRWRNALAVLDQLQAMSADPNPHVAALVCDRIPKAPNPDPALFH
jgi:hypothetical protein